MTVNINRFREVIFYSALFTLIPLWNIPHTIAGRYICEGILFICILLYKPEWKLFFQKSKLLLVFFTYLILQLLFFSENFNAALSNFRAEWMHFILFSIIGGGAGLVLGKRDPKKILLYFGIAFSIPLFIHVALFIFKGLSTGKIPWRYWGINEIHGDFAYPALEAAILFCTFYILQAKTWGDRCLSAALITVCVISPLLAQSRGGVVFVIAAILFVVLSHIFLGSGKNLSISKKILFLLSIPIFILGIYKIGVISDPDRWSGIYSRLAIGLEGNSNQVYCEGIKTLESALKEKGLEITPSIQKGLDSIVDGDGARIMAARSGIDLALKNPMGINQSKQAYQQSIIKDCGHNPAIFISHSHNGWIDTALAIGTPGAVLLLMVLIKYVKVGYVNICGSISSSPYGMALFASACMWILRGCVDSTMRDQMLEMQAFIFAALLGIIISRNKDLIDLNK